LSSLAVVATASFFGSQVEETFSSQGRPLQIGNSPALALPVPAGWPYLARVTWVDGAVRVERGDGTQELLRVDQSAEVTAEPITLKLTVVRRFRLTRWALPGSEVMLAWALVMMLSSVGSQQATLLYQTRCAWSLRLFGAYAYVLFPDCAASDSDASSLTAEYLSRLLRKDLAGDDVGQITDRFERERSERISREQRHFYLPAGQAGPKDKMGGAELVAPEPVRVPEPKDEVPEKKAEKKPPLVAPPGDGPQVPSPEAAADGAAETDLDAKKEDDLPPEDRLPAEEEQGWGIPDWYDQEDAITDQLEIELNTRVAQRLVRIDPDDAYALSLLSYYQYLAMDFRSAEKTYERYTTLYPDDPAGYNNKALVYKRLGKYKEEEALYNIALALEPEDVTALNNLAVNYAHQRRFDEALAVMRRLEVLDPDDAYADLHRAKIYAEMGDEAQALQYLEKALKGMQMLDTLHNIEFRQDIRVDPSFDRLRRRKEFRLLMHQFYGDDAPAMP
jgi:Tfp pilus assembly protein PilF